MVASELVTKELGGGHWRPRAPEAEGTGCGLIIWQQLHLVRVNDTMWVTVGVGDLGSGPLRHTAEECELDQSVALKLFCL